MRRPMGNDLIKAQIARVLKRFHWIRLPSSLVLLTPELISTYLTSFNVPSKQKQETRIISRVYHRPNPICFFRFIRIALSLMSVRNQSKLSLPRASFPILLLAALMNFPQWGFLLFLYMVSLIFFLRMLYRPATFNCAACNYMKSSLYK